MSNWRFHFWTKFVILNLVVLAFVGLILRYKIVFSLSWIDQKHLLHGHSHFAFTGWVSQALMILLFFILGRAQNQRNRKTEIILWSNLVCSYGMLFSFAAQGYTALSIAFSTLSIFLGYWFSFLAWKSSIRLNSPAARWLLKTGVVCHVISSAGAFALAIMMATHTVHQTWYLAAIYFFLHFEYNGWFILILLALLFEKLHNSGVITGQLKLVAIVFSICAFPTYFLSTLWMELKPAVFVLVVIAALAQLCGWIRFLWLLKKNIVGVKKCLSGFSGKVLLLTAIAMSIKLVLQAGSTIPELSTWAFGFRPIVIGYLHLVLLGVVSLGIFGMYMSHQLILLNTGVIKGVVVFISGVVLNEILLLLQAIGAISMTVVPWTNEFLILTSATMMLGAVIIFVSLKASQQLEAN